MTPFQFRHYSLVTLYKALADLKAEAARGYIGFLWWIVEPLLFMGVLYLIFSQVFRSGDVNFVAFLLCGLVPWKWFSSTVQTGAMAITSNRALITQVYVPKLVLPVAIVVANTLKFLVVLLLLGLVIVGFGLAEPANAHVLILAVLAQGTLVLGLTVLLSSVLPLLPEMRLVVDNAILLLFFLSGVFFDFRSRVDDQLVWIVDLNPLALLLDNYRASMLGIELQEAWLWDLGYVAFLGLISLAAGSLTISYLDRTYPKLRA